MSSIEQGIHVVIYRSMHMYMYIVFIDHENLTPLLGSHCPGCARPAGLGPDPANLIPISGDHIPGVGTWGGATFARVG